MNEFDEKFYQFVSELYLNLSLCKSKKEFKQKYPNLLSELDILSDNLQSKHDEIGIISSYICCKQEIIKQLKHTIFSKYIV